MYFLEQLKLMSFMQALKCTVICVCFHLVDTGTCFQPAQCKVTLYQFFDNPSKSWNDFQDWKAKFYYQA